MRPQPGEDTRLANPGTTACSVESVGTLAARAHARIAPTMFW